MSDRRTEILDAALSVLAGTGMRGLTHRAVDGAAGIAPGSTSYYFRSRAALVAGCVDRLVQVDREVGTLGAVADRREFLDLLVGVGEVMAGRERERTLARYELSVAAMHDPELRELLGEGATAVRRMCAAALGGLGATEPDEAAANVLTAFDGVLFAALVRGEERVGPTLRVVVGPVLAAQSWSE
jgi:DNA-binding transcriptional regulator YbjK